MRISSRGTVYMGPVGWLFWMLLRLLAGLVVVFVAAVVGVAWGLAALVEWICRAVRRRQAS